jgi:hypothetical protein
VKTSPTFDVLEQALIRALTSACVRDIQQEEASDSTLTINNAPTAVWATAADALTIGDGDGDSKQYPSRD